jgi:signal peptide peptidase SppA
MNLSAIPHFEQYLGPWAMKPEEFAALRSHVMGLNLHVHMDSPEARAAQARGYGSDPYVKDGVAIVRVHGTMMKHQSSLTMMGAACSTALARRELRSAVASENVGSILVHVDSPGGTVAGTAELAADVAAAASQKPAFAYIEDLGASAAYWVASSASKVYANATALVGSIGTYGVVYDESGAFEREGVKAYVIRAGEFKGVGTPGTAIEEKHLAEMQRRVDTLNSFFLNAVSAGRRLPLSRVQQIADGRVHVGDEARQIGLIDDVATLDAVFSALAKVRPPRERQAHAEAARLAEADPIAEFKAAVSQKMARGLNRQKATSAVVKEQPQLHRDYLNAVNPIRKR